MSAEFTKFEKDGSSYPMIKLTKSGQDKFFFQFGAGKARLILENLEAIRKFVADNPYQPKEKQVASSDDLIVE